MRFDIVTRYEAALRSAARRLGRSAVMAVLAVTVLGLTTLCGAQGQNVNVLTCHNDRRNNGVNSHETVLTPQLIRSSNFGKLFVTRLDGSDYGQPLVVSHVDITTGPHPGVQNVVFCATSRDVVYAINADNGEVLWKSSLLTRFHNRSDKVVAREANPNRAAKGQPLEDTPVIDLTTGALYIECQETEQGPGTGGKLHWIDLLVSLNVRNGRAYAHPIDIGEAQANGAYVSGPEVRKSSGGQDLFHARFITFRYLAIDPVNQVLYMACADPGDIGPYNGWILGYGAAKNGHGNLPVKAVWSSTPNGWAGGIWGGAIAFDRSGNLYVETGNGTFETSLIKTPYSGRLSTDSDDLLLPDKGDYGDAALKLSPDSDTRQHLDNPNGFGLHVSDYFVPTDEYFLLRHDLDIGSSSPVLLPPPVGSVQHRRLMIINDKQGTIYLLDRNHMGGYHGDAAGDGRSGVDDVVQKLPHATGPGFSTGAFFAGRHRRSGLIYFAAVSDHAKAFSISNAHINAHPVSESKARYEFPGSTPEISSDGVRNAIVWTYDREGNCIIAYSAASLRTVLFNSRRGTGRNGISNALTGRQADLNTTPTVVDGHVYVSTSDALNVYGPLVAK